MSLRSWDTVAARYSQLVSASPPTRLLPLRFMAHEGGGSAPLAAFRSAVYAEAFNGKVSVAVARNEAWVDGVGPGWHPTDTFFSRHRPVWGVDSLIMNCFVRHGGAHVSAVLSGVACADACTCRQLRAARAAARDAGEVYDTLAGGGVGHAGCEAERQRGVDGGALARRSRHLRRGCHRLAAHDRATKLAGALHSACFCVPPRCHHPAGAPRRRRAWICRSNCEAAWRRARTRG